MPHVHLFAMKNQQPKVDPKTIQLAREALTPQSTALAVQAAKAARLIDGSGIQAAANSVRDLQRLHVLDTESLVATFQHAPAFDAASASIAAMSRQNAERLASVSDTITASARDSMAALRDSLDLSATWREQIEKTVQALKLSTSIHAEVTAAISNVAVLSAADLAPRFTFAIAEAVALAETPEVASTVDMDALDDLAPKERTAIRGDVLDLISKIGQLVAVLASQQRIEAAALLLGILASLILIHSRLDGE